MIDVLAFRAVHCAIGVMEELLGSIDSAAGERDSNGRRDPHGGP